MSDDDAIVKEFLVESCENLDRLGQDLVVPEKDPSQSRDPGQHLRPSTRSKELPDF